jgi:hypothetical protein
MRKTFYFPQSSFYACLGSNSFSARLGATTRLHQLQFIFDFRSHSSFSPQTEMIKNHLGFLPLSTGNFIIGWAGGIFFFVASVVEVVFIVYKAFSFSESNEKSDEKRTGNEVKDSVDVHLTFIWISVTIAFLLFCLFITTLHGMIFYIVMSRTDLVRQKVSSEIQWNNSDFSA